MDDMNGSANRNAGALCWIGILCGLGYLAGCSGPAGTSTKSAAEPMDAMKNVFQAYETNNRELFLNNVYFKPEHQKYIDAKFEAEVVFAAFRRQLAGAYGSGCFKGRQCLDGMPHVGTINSTLLGRKPSVRVHDRSGSIIYLRPNCQIYVTVKGGSWKVNLAGRGKDTRQLERNIGYIRGVKRAVEAACENIGKPGYDADRIDKELFVAAIEQS